MGNTKLIIIAILALVIGAVAGYYYGNSVAYEKGVIDGRQTLLDEQKAAEETALKKIQEAANPFSDIENKANPFKDVYTNPFAQ